MTDIPFSTISKYVENCPYEVSNEELHVLSGATVVYFDYDAIINDFPWLLMKERRDTIHKIEHWAKSMAAVSSGHISGSNVNRPLRGTGERINAIRPPRYGRASVVDSAAAMGFRDVPKTQRRLCDIKGCGIHPNLTAYTQPHSTGLVTMIEAFVEIVNRKILERIFDESNLPHRCLPYYAVVDLGFRHDSVYEKNARSALVLRKAHFRPENNEELPKQGSEKQAAISEIEQVLHSFCMTSAAADVAFEVKGDSSAWKGHFGGQQLDWLSHDHIVRIAEEFDVEFPNQFRLINIQMTESGKRGESRELVDFSHYCFSDFQNSYYEVTPASDRPLNFGMIRKIGANYNRESEFFCTLEKSGFFRKHKLNESQLLAFGNPEADKEYSMVVKFVHELVAKLGGEGFDGSATDQMVANFVDSALPLTGVVAGIRV